MAAGHSLHVQTQRRGFGEGSQLVVDGVTGRRQANRSLATTPFGGALTSGMLAGEAVVPQADGVKVNGVGRARSKHHQGRPWTSMQESTCRWNARACALSMRPARLCGRQGCKRAWIADCVVRRARLRSGRVGLQTGPLSQWLSAELKLAGLAVEL